MNMSVDHTGGERQRLAAEGRASGADRTDRTSWITGRQPGEPAGQVLAPDSRAELKAKAKRLIRELAEMRHEIQETEETLLAVLEMLLSAGDE
jgi:hypothetical protein